MDRAEFLLKTLQTQKKQEAEKLKLKEKELKKIAREKKKAEEELKKAEQAKIEKKKAQAWNPVLKYFVDLKNEYMEKTGKEIEYKKYPRTFIIYDEMAQRDVQVKKVITCVEEWIEELDDDKHRQRINPLSFSQRDEILLVRYGREEDCFDEQEETANLRQQLTEAMSEEEKNKLLEQLKEDYLNKKEKFWNSYKGFYRECRSVVIDLKKEQLVLTPFAKFFNLGEMQETTHPVIMDIMPTLKNIEITDKKDGSMQCATCYEGEIFMSSSKSIEPNGSWRLVSGMEMLYSQSNYVDMVRENPDYTFIFEYIALKDAHVVVYEKEDEGLYLLGIRETNTGKQLTYKEVLEIGKYYGVRTTEIFKNESFFNIMNSLDNYKSNEKEGWVLNLIKEDGTSQLIKLKCNDYVGVHKLISKISSVNVVIKNIADNTYDDLVAKVPETYKNRVLKISQVIFEYLRKMEKDISKYANQIDKTQEKKDIMIWIDENVPKSLKTYVRNEYLGVSYSLLKTKEHTATPHYKNAKELGIQDKIDELMADENF